MKGSKLTDSQMVEAIKRVGGGLPVSEVCRELGISSATLYKWRSRFGGMDTSIMSQMKELEVRMLDCAGCTSRRSSKPRSWRRRSKKVVRPSRRHEMTKEVGKDWRCRFVRPVWLSASVSPAIDKRPSFRSRVMSLRTGGCV